MKHFLILVYDVENLEMVKNGLSQYGEFIVFFEKNFLFETNLNSAQEIYNHIEKTNQINIVIIEMGTINAGSYWGFANKELWKWLKEREQ